MLPEAIESIAILHGLQFCLQMGISNVMVELDCQVIVNDLRETQASLSPQGNILQEIRGLMGHFQTCNVQFANRQSNAVTHSLARHACSISDVVMWYEDVPTFISRLVWIDRNSCNRFTI